jgi:hypothetical protein
VKGRAADEGAVKMQGVKGDASGEESEHTSDNLEGAENDSEGRRRYRMMRRRGAGYDSTTTESSTATESSTTSML